MTEAMTAKQSAAVLVAEALSLRLGGREVLRGMSLTVRPGEIIAVAGPNGAGKSTLLRVLAGLNTPDHGSVRVDGVDLQALDRRTLGRRIAYLPQDRTVHWPLKARAVVALGRLPHGAGPGRGESDHDRRMIDGALAATDAAPLAGRPISELSGGERARVLIARALAQDAGILIADEPTAGLDPAHALSLFQTFTRIAAEGRAVIVALHDLGLALRYCPRVLLIKDGLVAASGPARDVLTEPEIARVYGVSAKVGVIGGVPTVVPVAPLT
jgi:iron complex transport system ATP-binding protein